MLDAITVISYLAITLLIGIFAGKETKTFSDFAVGKRNFSTLVLLAAIMASLMEASETIDFTRQVLTDGLVYCIAYLGSAFAPLSLAYFFAPKFGKFLGSALTTGDLMQEFFGIRAKTLIGIFTIFEMILLTGAQILAISLVAHYFFGLPKELSAIAITVITLIYFLRGGARSVNATDVFQFGIMVVLLPILCGIALTKIGGVSTILSLVESKGINFTTSHPASNNESWANFIIFAMPGLFPLMIQRMLMAKDTKQLKQSLILNAIVGTPLRIVIIALGIGAFLLIPNVNPEISLLELANQLVPSGFKGLIIVGFLAILMSTIDSALHLGAVAYTQDFLGSFLRKSLDDEKKLKTARYAAVFITIGALFIALNFENIEYIFYLLMALGNSVMWPGLFLGLTGLTSSKKGFWLGVITSLVTVYMCVFIFDVFLLYANLIGLLANTLVHVFYAYVIEKNRISIPPLFASINSQIFQIKNWKSIASVRFVTNQDYCNIFSILSIFLSIYPFFIMNHTAFHSTLNMFLIFHSIIGACAILLLFRELWNQKFSKLYPSCWVIMVTLTLPTQTYFMIFNTSDSFVWIIDAIIIIPLLITLTARLTAILLYIIGIALAAFATIAVGPSFLQITPDFGNWAVLMHILVLALCLALFRKRDVEMCRFTTATLIHETKRALSTFEGTANYYEKRLPELISQYRNFAFSGEGSISQTELKTMVALPIEIKKLSHRTQNLLTKFYDQISSYSGNRIFTNVSLNNCISTAISDASLDKDLRECIHFNTGTDLIVKGDHDQLVQVLINLLENSGHALVSTKNPRIDITVLGLTIFITDNGKGISPVDLPNIFDELFSTKSTTGQGLAFCKRAMIEHGGNILCTSRKNEFTRFELRFPAKYEWSL